MKPKQIMLTLEEAEVVIFMLKYNWAPQEYQKLVYDLVMRLEEELGKLT